MEEKEDAGLALSGRSPRMAVAAPRPFGAKGPVRVSIQRGSGMAAGTSRGTSARGTSARGLAAKAYEFIQEGILSGRLSAGSVISEGEVARAVGISRTPVREAIRQLMNEGLLDQRPRYGTIVRTVDRQDLVEMFEMREAIEGHAAYLATERMTAHGIQELSRYLEMMRQFARHPQLSDPGYLDDENVSRFLAADMAFHHAIVHLAGNRRLVNVVMQMRLLTRLFRPYTQSHTATVLQDACDWHDRILAAIQSQDPAAAQQTMLGHLRAGKEKTLRLFDFAGGLSPVTVELPPDIQRELDTIEQESRPAQAPSKGGRHA